jgi:hypothetical protein
MTVDPILFDKVSEGFKHKVNKISNVITGEPRDRGSATKRGISKLMVAGNRHSVAKNLLRAQRKMNKIPATGGERS